MSDSTNPSASELEEKSVAAPEALQPSASASEAKMVSVPEELLISLREELAKARMALSANTGSSQQQATPVHKVASERETAVQRQVIMGNSRQSILLQSSPSLSSPPHSVPAAPPNPRRLNMAEQLSSSPYITPRRPLRESEGESEETEGEKWEVNEKGWKDLIKKKKEPNTFSGDPSKDVDDARSWVRDVDSYLDLYLSDSLGRRQEGNRLRWVLQQSSGVAKQWIQGEIDQGAKLLSMNLIKKPVEWVDVKENFIKYFEGPQYLRYLEMEMKKLRLGKGKTRTLQAFNSAWDHFRVRLYPTSDVDEAMDRVVGSMYSQAILESDPDLWDKATTMDVPDGLSAWKERVLNIFTAMEAKKAIKGGTARPSGTGYYGQHGSGGRGSNRYGGYQSSQTTVANTNATPTELGAESDSEADDGKGSEEAELQQAAGRASNGRSNDTNNNDNGGRLPYKHLEEVMKFLSDNKRCFRCWSDKHRSFKCKVHISKLPKTAPTLQQVKGGAWSL
jgi:hypothetical protein